MAEERVTKLVKVEMIGDGEGQVYLFVNGQPWGEFQADWEFPIKVRRLLADMFCRYKPHPEEEEESDP